MKSANLFGYILEIYNIFVNLNSTLIGEVMIKNIYQEVLL